MVVPSFGHIEDPGLRTQPEEAVVLGALGTRDRQGLRWHECWEADLHHLGVLDHAIRRIQQRDKADAAVSIFTMRSPNAARAIFESEPTAGSRPLPIGDDARSYGASITLRRGPHFVRLVAFEDLPRELADLARLLAAEL